MTLPPSPSLFPSFPLTLPSSSSCPLLPFPSFPPFSFPPFHLPPSFPDSLHPPLPTSPLSFHQPIGDWGSPDGVRCKVDTQLYLVCPDHTHKKNHEVIPVNNKNKESCMDTWVDSQVLEFGSLLRGCRVEVPRPGMHSLTLDCSYTYLSHLYTEVSMRLLL